MDARGEVEAFLARWTSLNEARDAERAADLFQRDPAPLVTFTDGQRAHDWVDVRVRLGRDLSRVVIGRVECHDIEVREVSEDALAVSFVYDMAVRDVWGMPGTLRRLASMTLVHTKDGLRIASAHFSAPPP